MPDGGILIMGGTEGMGTQFFKPWTVYELWDPPANSSAAFPRTTKAVPLPKDYVAQSTEVLYPFNYVLPSGDLLTFSSRYGRVIAPRSGAVRATLPQLTGAYDTQVGAGHGEGEGEREREDRECC